MITFRTKSDVNNTNEDNEWYDNIELLENENNLKQTGFLFLQRQRNNKKFVSNGIKHKFFLKFVY